MMTRTWYLDSLACPDCTSPISLEPLSATCKSCNYKRTFSDKVDLRPRNPRPLTSTFRRHIEVPDVLRVLDLVELSRPQIVYQGPSAIRDSRELLSAIKPYLSIGSRILDLGCGPRDQAIPLQHLGYAYVGLDYTNPAADILGDAHALPFKSDVFDCVLSYAVLQHLHNPFVAIQETKRVLKKGGIYCGTVSQGEPFQASFFHLTAWGLASLTATSGMALRRMWPSYDSLRALARNGRYPRVLKKAIGVLDLVHTRFPFLAPRRMRWSTREKQLDEIYRTGNICFLIQRQ